MKRIIYRLEGTNFVGTYFGDMSIYWYFVGIKSLKLIQYTDLPSIKNYPKVDYMGCVIIKE